MMLLEGRALVVPSSTSLRLADRSDHKVENKRRLIFSCRIKSSELQSPELTRNHNTTAKLTTLTHSST
jgi:hypothetical protein